jgi:hypothetical protein
MAVTTAAGNPDCLKEAASHLITGDLLRTNL